MADLSLKITAETAAASAAFKDLASSSEVLQRKIAQPGEDMGNSEADRFIQQQKLAAVAMQATGKETEGLQKAHAAYEREIQNLIKKGVDPESEAIQKLRAEMENCDKELAKQQKLTGDAAAGMKLMETAAKASAAALAAIVTATAAAVQKTAEAGDAAAKTARVIGTTAEAWQELSYAAKMSGVESSTLQSSMQKLNKTMGDLKSGSGTLAKYLGENDKALLKNLQSAGNTEQAFTLLMDAINKAPDEFTRAQLAQEAFGKSGQDLIKIAEVGTDGIAALREEARKYGVISNETAAQSEEFLDAQTRVKAALAGVGTQISSGLIPTLTQGINKIADFIAGVDDIRRVAGNVAIALAGITAGITAFLVIAKLPAIIAGLTKAFHALNAAMASNPFGLIALGVTALITVLLSLIPILRCPRNAPC